MKLRLFTASLLFQLSILSLLAAEPGMMFILGGTFFRGRSHELPDDGLKWVPTLLKDDRPVRRIIVDPFYLDKYEVTNQQYLIFIKATERAAPYYWSGTKPAANLANYPVVNINWEEAFAYCAWLERRLPTEAEWERGSRGLRERGTYPWGNDSPTKDLARFDRMDGPGAVGLFPENYFGLCDMAGNVWEWCSDWYEKNYYEHAPEKNPLGPEEGRYRVLRGGSWADAPKYLTCAYRSFTRPTELSPNIGFRCAKSFP